MWIAKSLYNDLCEEKRLARATAAQTETLLEAAIAENAALRAELAAQREALDADRTALREAAVSLHQHVTGDGDAVSKLAERAVASAANRILSEQRKVAALHERLAIADANFGWCRQLVNMMMGERATLLQQRGIIVPHVNLTPPGVPAGPPVAGQGVPGEFVDADNLAGAMGISFEDVGDEAAARMKLTQDDPLL